jgi:hypothetical protein
MNIRSRNGSGAVFAAFTSPNGDRALHAFETAIFGRDGSQDRAGQRHDRFLRLRARLPRRFASVFGSWDAEAAAAPEADDLHDRVMARGRCEVVGWQWIARCGQRARRSST